MKNHNSPQSLFSFESTVPPKAPAQKRFPKARPTPRSLRRTSPFWEPELFSASSFVKPQRTLGGAAHPPKNYHSPCVCPFLEKFRYMPLFLLRLLVEFIGLDFGFSFLFRSSVHLDQFLMIGIPLPLSTESASTLRCQLLSAT